MGIDNGVSGSMGIIIVTRTNVLIHFLTMPTKSEQNYTKKKGNITRIVFSKLFSTLVLILPGDRSTHVMMERPLVNPTRFKATTSALRAMEATLCVLEEIGLPLSYIDSKEWQKELLPKGTKGTTELKKASRDIGSRLFPMYKEAINKHGDADGLLIAEYCRRVKR